MLNKALKIREHQQKTFATLNRYWLSGGGVCVNLLKKKNL